MTGDRTILVTGGAGFIGSHLVKRLLARHPRDRVLVLDALTYAGSLARFDAALLRDPRFEFVQGTVCGASLVGSLIERSDVVVHLAAETHVPRSILDNHAFFDTDVIGTQVVASQAALRARRLDRVVHVSTSEVYGTAAYSPMDEAHPLEPTTPYAAAKCGADRLMASFVHTYGLPALLVRPFNTWGPAQHPEKLVARVVCAALEGERPEIHGDGSAARDWTHVDDICEAILLLVDAPRDRVIGEVVNVGAGRAVAVRDVVRRVMEVCGRDPGDADHVPDRPGQVLLHEADATKLERLVGFRPRTSLEEALPETVLWYREHESWWRPLRWMQTVGMAAAGGGRW